uniref:ATP synthase complex subunit 8 n=1 Tax=Fleutiauxia armata TaxID=1205662 RepID=A0A0S2MQF2_9CUCU|nr:ATP synthase F0 subunit 8 [Fleutiauxia armata]
MPQMMPLNWLSLMIFFIYLYLLFNTLIYYNFLYSPKTSTIKKITLKYTWKW